MTATKPYKNLVMNKAPTPSGEWRLGIHTILESPMWSGVQVLGAWGYIRCFGRVVWGIWRAHRVVWVLRCFIGLYTAFEAL